MFKFLLAILLTELLTELAVKSTIFKPIREKIIGLSSWLGELVSCGYCFSVWVAAAVVFSLQLSYNLTGLYWIDLLLTAFITHRLANYLHNFNDKWLDKYYDGRFVNSDH